MLQLIDLDRGNYAHEIQVWRPDGRGETVLAAGVGDLEKVVLLPERWGMQVLREG